MMRWGWHLGLLLLLLLMARSAVASTTMAAAASAAAVTHATHGCAAGPANCKA
jgi:hypothetical protein